MLSIPAVSTMLAVIGVALFATAALVVLLGQLLGLGRTQATAKPATATVRIPVQRHSDRKTPVASR